MKIFAPKYYNDFKCIAGKCKHTCCALWEMPVDEKALDYYKSLGEENARWVLSKIESGEEPHFCMDENRRCAFLRDDGLCEMIIRLGENSLCSVCREHPRFYNLLSNRCEVGLGFCCEEAVRVAMTSESDELVEVGVDDEPCSSPDEIEKTTLDFRSKAFSIMGEIGTLNEKILRLEKLFTVPKKATKVKEMLSVFLTLEELESGFHDLLSSIETDGEIKSEYDEKLTRLLKYFIYRHTTLSESEFDFAVRLGFCTLSIRIVDALVRGKDEDYFIETVRRYCAEIEYSDDNMVALMGELAWE
jgi:lysine-N-methylase